MPSLFIGVYEALYPYAAQSDQELDLAQGDLLYLLEKSTEDDWWNVKKRVLGLETEEPTGLVPNNYIQPAPVVSRARALFDYDRQTDEELSFKENEIFDVFDANDQDWILVGLNDAEFGFVPSNYIEYVDEQQQQQQQSQPSVPAAAAAASAAASVAANQEQRSMPAYDKPLPTPSDAYARPQPSRQYSDDYEEDETPPPMPARPRPNQNREPPQEEQNQQKSSFFNWQVQEVDGRKKHKATLAIGNGMIMYSPEKMAPQQWDVQDLVNYSLEKKHVFLDFKNPTVNLDLHAGSKETAEDILAAIGEVAGANKAVGLREVYMAANSAGQPIGKVLFDFEAKQDDEVSAKEGDNVFILDNKTSDQWWMVKTADGQEGVMPSSYIELSSSSSKNASSSSRQHKRRSSDKKKGHERGPSLPSKPKPDMSKVRTWTDRSGTFKVDAALLGCADGKIHLHKVNGVKIAVAAGKMSVEDLEYIERVTGVVLDDDKPLVDVKRNSIRKPQSKQGVPGGVSTGNGGQKASPPPSSSANGTSSVPPSKESDYDWFGFFLECGVDVNNCQRYAINFSRDQMDESILEDITPQVLRNLGLKEGDILRVTKKLDEKFDRRNKQQQGGLFSEAGGVLKNNTTRHDNKEQPKSLDKKDGFEDDAWAVKSPPSPKKDDDDKPPAKPPRPSASQPQPQPQQPQPTGSMKDLLTMQPLEPVKTQTTANGAPAPTTSVFNSIVTGQQNAPAPVQQPPVLQRSSTMPLQQQQQPVLTGQLTGGQIPTQLTGGPMQSQLTGGAMQAQLTGRSIQQQQQPLGPFATGNSQPLGPFATGNAQPLGPFATGNVQQVTGMSTGSSQFMGGPNSMNAQMAALSMNNTQQQQQPTMMQQPMMQQPQPQPAMGFQYMQQQPSYSTPNFNNGMMMMPQQQQQQQPPVLQPALTGGAPPPVFQQQQQPPNGQLQGQPTGFGFGNQPSAFPSAAQTLSMDANSQYAPIQPQKTGPPPPVSFGGQQQPLQRTPTGRRANLAAATPNNPFGF